jgi:hypothetical protein
MATAVSGNRGHAVKLCYCDESGTGSEPIATMAGVLVDAARMEKTKREWAELFDELAAMSDKRVAEIKGSDLYHGNGPWRGVEASQRVRAIDTVLEWTISRRHKIVYSAVVKESFRRSRRADEIYDELSDEWRFMGFHLILAVQKEGKKRAKGRTIFVFDNHERDRVKFADLVLNPRTWSHEYYGCGKKEEPLGLIVDVPYFGDSKDIGLIQLADVAAFLLRRYAEVRTGLVRPEYDGEGERLAGWARSLGEMQIGARPFPRKGRNDAEDLFWQNAPEPIREL